MAALVGNPSVNQRLQVPGCPQLGCTAPGGVIGFFYNPQNGTTIQQPVGITFNVPATATITASDTAGNLIPLTVTPNGAQTVYTITPTSQWPNGVANITVSNIRSIDGTCTSNNRTVPYTTVLPCTAPNGLLNATFTPATSQSTTETVVATFNTTVDPSTVNFTASGPNNQPINVTVTPQPGNQVFNITGAWLNGTNVITLQPGTRSADGRCTLGQLQHSLTVQVPCVAPVTVTRSPTGDLTSFTTPVVLTFSEPMNQGSAFTADVFAGANMITTTKAWNATSTQLTLTGNWQQGLNQIRIAALQAQSNPNCTVNQNLDFTVNVPCSAPGGDLTMTGSNPTTATAPFNLPVTFQFDAPVNTATVLPTAVTATNVPINIAPTWSNGNQTLTVTPIGEWPIGANVITLAGGITSADGTCTITTPITHTITRQACQAPGGALVLTLQGSNVVTTATQPITIVSNAPVSLSTLSATLTGVGNFTINQVTTQQFTLTPPNPGYVLGNNAMTINAGAQTVDGTCTAAQQAFIILRQNPPCTAPGGAIVGTLLGSNVVTSPTQTITIGFNTPVNAGTVNVTQDSNNQVLTVVIDPGNPNQVLVSPPTGGWPSGVTPITLNAGYQSVDGTCTGTRVENILVNRQDPCTAPGGVIQVTSVTNDNTVNNVPSDLIFNTPVSLATFNVTVNGGATVVTPTQINPTTIRLTPTTAWNVGVNNIVVQAGLQSQDGTCTLATAINQVVNKTAPN